MNEQEKLTAVEQVEKLLLTTQDTISTILWSIVTPELAEKYGHYSYRKSIKDAFRKKHGMGLSTWREKHTGIPDSQYKSMDAARKLEGRMETVKRLLSNTEFTQINVAKLAGVTPAQINAYLKREGLGTSKTFRKANVQQPSIYTEQPVNRRRVRVNGGMHLKRTETGPSLSTYQLEALPNKAILSLTIMGFSFNVTQIDGGELKTKRLEFKDAMLIKTGFLVPSTVAVSWGETMVFPSPSNTNELIQVFPRFELTENRLVFASTCPLSNISFTMMVTDTDL